MCGFQRVARSASDVPGVKFVKLASNRVFGGGFEEFGDGDGGGVGFTDGFAVPAGTFGVDCVEHFLVGFRGPGKGVGEFVFVDFVVVVDEDIACFERVLVIGCWR